MHNVICVILLLFVEKYVATDVTPFKTCKGKRVDATSIKSLKVRSKIECATACARERECLSSNFFKSNKSCELFAESYYNEDCDTIAADSSSTILRKWTNPCKNGQPLINGKCQCNPDLSGKYCEIGPRDCSDDTPGSPSWKDIYPEDGKGKIKVWCWTYYLLMFGVPSTGWTYPYWNRNWTDYRNGFGDVKTNGNANGGYWLGNENTHRITSSSYTYKLRFYPANPRERWYYNFRIGSETDDYKFYFNTYSNSGADVVIENGKPFRTYDHNDNGCAAQHGYGFWFGDSCPTAQIFNGQTYQGGNLQTSGELWVEIVRV